MTAIEKIRQGLKDHDALNPLSKPDLPAGVSMNANEKSDYAALQPLQKLRMGLLMANGLSAADAKANALASSLVGR